MKWLLAFWAGPILLLGGWYGLSYYDMSFGIFMLTRQTHDLVFQIYGEVLGMPPETIPPLVAQAIAFDSVLLFSIIGLRRHRTIAAWWRRRQSSLALASGVAKDESLSSAP